MLNRLSHKLLFGMAAVTVSVGVLVALALGDLSAWNRAADRLEQGSHTAVMDGVFHSSLTRATSEAVSFAVTGSEHYRKEAADALIYAHSAMAQLRRASGGPGERDQRPELRQLRQRQEIVLTQVRNNVNKTLREQDGTIKDRLETLYAAEEEGDDIWHDVLAWHDAERRTLAQDMREIEGRMLRLVSATLLLGLIWVLALLAYLARAVTGPINRLAQAAERIAGGDLEQQVAVTSRDEIGTLQGSFNRMVQNLRECRSAPPARAQEPAGRTDPSPPVAAVAPHDAGSTPSPAAAAPAKADRRVLLVEVDAASRELTKAMLQHCGMQVTVAERGSEARAALAAEAFDLVLLDCELTEPEIAQTMDQIRASSGPAGAVPIVALTAEDSVEASERCLAAGMIDHLSKPVSFFDLHALLARWLQPA